MIRVRLAFYALYTLLGTIILVRLLSAGFHWETIGGLVLGLALIALGAYRLRLYIRMNAARRQ